MQKCHDCGVEEGQIHKWGCDMERCPMCGGQLITCQCGPDFEEDRIPYILYPNVCAMCGELWPGMFTVSDFEWEKYIEPAMRGQMLCRSCYAQIKEAIDSHAGADQAQD